MTRPIVIVSGGRDYTDRRAVFTALDALDPSIVIHGDNSTWNPELRKVVGADRFAREWASDHGDVIHIAMPAAWDSVLGRRAGPVRNRDMVSIALKLTALEISEGREASVAALIFPGSRGTRDLRYQASEAGIRIVEGLTHEHQ